MARVKLSPGDEVRVIAPSHSFAIISQETRLVAQQRLKSLGLVTSFGKYIEECDEFLTSSVASRIEDLHAAFIDPNVKAIMTVIGGCAANQLLPYIDWDLIRRNPKPLIGYSDTTLLQVAMYTKAGIVSYSGPAFSTFGQKEYFGYTMEHFKKCVMQDSPFQLEQSNEWTDDQWYLDQEKRSPIKNEGWLVLGSGETSGTLIGGNLNTLRLLQGTEYFPSLQNTILFLEDDDLTTYSIFDRELESLTQLDAFEGVRGVVLGRFQNKSAMPRRKIERLVCSKARLKHLPIIADVDFGHTSPLCTLPIGGTATISTTDKTITIR